MKQLVAVTTYDYTALHIRLTGCRSLHICLCMLPHIWLRERCLTERPWRTAMKEALPAFSTLREQSIPMSGQTHIRAGFQVLQAEREREFLIDNLLSRIHFIIVMISFLPMFPGVAGGPAVGVPKGELRRPGSLHPKTKTLDPKH